MKIEINSSHQVVDVYTKNVNVDTRKSSRKLEKCYYAHCKTYTSGKCKECGLSVCHIHCLANKGVCYDCMDKIKENEKNKKTR